MKKLYAIFFVIFILSSSIYGKSSDGKGKYYGIPLALPLGTFGVVNSAGNISTPVHLSSLPGGETEIGSIISKEFKIEVPVIKLFARGWNGFKGDKNLNRFELVDAKTGKVVRKAKPPQSTTVPKWIEWDVKDLKGENVKIRIVDGDSNKAYAWLGIDRIDGGPEMQINFNANPELDIWEVETENTEPKSLIHFGVPYLVNSGFAFKQNDTRKIELGFKAKKILLFGLTFTPDIGTPLWHYAADYSIRYFIGDELGRIKINYFDKTSEEFPLVLGDNLWWGQRFYNYPEPFASNKEKSKILENSLFLLPAKPVQGGFRMGVIEPKNKKIVSIEFSDRKEKLGTPVINAMTVLVEDNIEVGKLFSNVKLEKEVINFIESSVMKPAGVCEENKKQRLDNIRNAMYTTEKNFPKSVPVSKPQNYRGPDVKFDNGVYGEILENIFYHNLADMDKKADGETGQFRESTKNSASFGGYQGFGTYKEGHAPYWNDAWSRGIGREVPEYLAFGFYDKTKKCVDYCFRQARLWENKKNDLKVKGVPLPGHWCRNIAKPMVGKTMGAFENDGHGMIMLTVHSLWRKLPKEEKNKWLEERWDDVKMAADWIDWQFENPEVSGATNDVLLTDSEANFSIFTGIGYGYTIYADYPCMDGLLGFAEMAESIGKNKEAKKWRDRAKKMKIGMEKNYIERINNKPPMWTRHHAGWSYLTSHLAPLIFLADRRGFKPEDDDPEWRKINRTTYKRKIDKWSGKAPMNDDEWWWYLPQENRYRNHKELYFPKHGNFTVAMGYGQGFMTQAALLLDEMKDAEAMLEWTAKGTYYADHKSYIVPEGVEFDPEAKFWFRTGDLGNGFQQASIMKVIRLVIGVDDTNPKELTLIPRIPKSWKGLSVDKFPAWVEAGDEGVKRVDLKFKYELGENKASFKLEASDILPETLLRLGPFGSGISKNLKVKLNDKNIKAKVTKSGDSNWVRIKIPKGLKLFEVAVKSND